MEAGRVDAVSVPDVLCPPVSSPLSLFLVSDLVIVLPMCVCGQHTGEVVLTSRFSWGPATAPETYWWSTLICQTNEGFCHLRATSLLTLAFTSELTLYCK